MNSFGYINTKGEVDTPVHQAANVANIDQCVAIVQALDPNVGGTGSWREHKALDVNGAVNSSIGIGTPIATFGTNGRYGTADPHAAIYLGAAIENGVSGFLMLDQYVGQLGLASEGLPENQHAEIHFHAIATATTYFSIA